MGVNFEAGGGELVDAESVTGVETFRFFFFFLLVL
jgi:hypothetical protein